MNLLNFCQLMLNGCWLIPLFQNVMNMCFKRINYTRDLFDERIYMYYE